MSCMDDAKRDLIRAWLTKANHDLATELKLASGDDPILDTAVYHCQQAAEKAIKAILIFHDHRFSKTHDLRSLLNEVNKVGVDLSAWEEAADLLTPLATTYRYPGLLSEPPRDE